jgi:hypothetical protein
VNRINEEAIEPVYHILQEKGNGTIHSQYGRAFVKSARLGQGLAILLEQIDIIRDCAAAVLRPTPPLTTSLQFAQRFAKVTFVVSKWFRR